MAGLCKHYGVPFVVDAAQSAGSIELDFEGLGADFIAMPGHKGLLGPQGTGLLLCGRVGQPLLFGGTGSDSIRREMPEYLPERLEAGTVNVPGIAGLAAGLRHISRLGPETIGRRERTQAAYAARELKKLGLSVPDTTALLSELKKEGFDLSLDALTVEECADAIIASLK